jgi:hypothetical protein
MASGIFYVSGWNDPAPTSAVLYTCPAGVSYAVINIAAKLTWGSGSFGAIYGELLINNKTLFYSSPNAPGTLDYYQASLILTPGDVLSFQSVTSIWSLVPYLLVSGYTVV